MCKYFTASVLAPRLFVKILIETNVKISNELNLSRVYQSVNYTESLAK